MPSFSLTPFLCLLGNSPQCTFLGLLDQSDSENFIPPLSPPSRADLAQSEYSPLRLELFNALARFSCGPNVVRIQLCKALVAFSFQTMPEVWPNAVVSMIHSLRSAAESVPVSVGVVSVSVGVVFVSVDMVLLNVGMVPLSVGVVLVSGRCFGECEHGFM